MHGDRYFACTLARGEIEMLRRGHAALLSMTYALWSAIYRHARGSVLSMMI